MRWLITNPHPIIGALEAAGETVVNVRGDFQIDAMPWLADAAAQVKHEGTDRISVALCRMKTPADVLTIHYRLDRLLRDRRPDVLVMTPFNQPALGFPLNVLNKWRSGRLDRTLVGIGQDPATWQAAKEGSWRGCSVRLQHLALYVFDHVASAKAVGRERRTSYWAPGQPLDPVLDGVAHARSGKTWHAGRRSTPFPWRTL